MSKALIAEEMRKCLSCYKEILKKKAEIKKKKELISLDNWVQNKLGADIGTRKPAHITKDELTQLMKWKLMRGKFRPRLTELVQENSDESVKSASTQGFKTVSSPKKSIQELCKLRGVGPATASAILAAFRPDKFAFMADESVQAVLTGKIDYTLPYYIEYLCGLNKEVESLKKSDASGDWTVHKLELALWSKVVAGQIGFSLDVESNDEDVAELDANNNTELDSDLVIADIRLIKSKKVTMKSTKRKLSFNANLAVSPTSKQKKRRCR